MLAMAACLVITLATIAACTDLPEDDELDRLTLPETAHLIAALALTIQHTAAYVLGWSRWRRRKNKAPGKATTAAAISPNHETHESQMEY